MAASFLSPRVAVPMTGQTFSLKEGRDVRHQDRWRPAYRIFRRHGRLRQDEDSGGKSDSSQSNEKLEAKAPQEIDDHLSSRRVDGSE